MNLSFSRLVLCLFASLVFSNAVANSPPTLILEPSYFVTAGDTLSFQVSPGDADGDVPGVFLDKPLPGSSLLDNGDGTRTFSWTPSEADIGSRSVEFKVTDANDADIGTTVTTNISVASKEQPDNVVELSVSGLDPQRLQVGDEFKLIVRPTSTDLSVPGIYLHSNTPDVNFLDNLDGSRTLTWTADNPGIREFLFTTFHPDGKAEPLDTILTVTVEASDQNDPDSNPLLPVFEPISPIRTIAGSSLNIDLRAISTEGTPTISALNLPTRAYLYNIDNGSARLSWQTLPEQSGNQIITFLATSDDDPDLVTRLDVQITLDPPRQNNYPVLGALEDEYSVVPGELLTINLSATDADGSIPTFSLRNDSPEGASIVNNGDGTGVFEWQTNPDTSGEYSIRLDANDSDRFGYSTSIRIQVSTLNLCIDNSGIETLRASCLTPDIGFLVRDSDSDIFGYQLEPKAAGDINGDGISDVLLHLQGYHSNQIAHVILGEANASSSEMDLSNLPEGRSFTISGQRSDTVQHAGDINGDGYADIAVSYGSRIEFVFGQANLDTIGASIDTLSVSNANNTDEQNELFSNAYITDIDYAKDFNGDGINDLLVGVNGLNNFEIAQPTLAQGIVVIVYGSPSMASAVNISDITPETGLVFSSPNTSSIAGYRVESVGDFNADGLSDFVTFDRYYENNYLILGSHQTGDSTGILDGFLNPNVTRLISGTGRRECDATVSGSGDYNNDGFDDLAAWCEYGRRPPVVVFGQATAFPPIVDLLDSTGFSGVSLFNDSDYSQDRLLSIDTDVTGDGVADLLIGTDSNERGFRNNGAVYVLAGGSDVSDSNSEMLKEEASRIIVGSRSEARIGQHLRSMGDINGDGIGDFSLGIRTNDRYGEQAYILFGKQN